MRAYEGPFTDILEFSAAPSSSEIDHQNDCILIVKLTTQPLLCTQFLTTVLLRVCSPMLTDPGFSQCVATVCLPILIDQVGLFVYVFA